MAGRRIAVVAMVWVSLHPTPCSAAARMKWWRSEVAVARLGLTPAQVERIDAIFEETKPDRLRLQAALDDLESALARAIDDGQDARAEDLVPRVESARMAHNTARTMMLIRMFRVLTREQRAKLNDIRDLIGGSPAAPSTYRAGP
jgi:Spy/CpxP family protein refolding chaperone